ncbi:MAG TPA: carboxylating nicotinate-nucleotide diphosphorylase [Acidobacteriota bacterium]|mgnify:FL=1|nr:carboxylating nicotinate-nucleotide diphosphorylase [Acidobacteriota bacterium]HNR38884.1 carboxylating nicotinate-nucleotide diphosphorylase [Acidobacteriota bacterium]HNU00172.1 carboxylating nicotinate-nucleotide diphosphorylase [Acidobacteriota bacterium]HPB29219.1 carboxylating nicotinate-nucleotide diphosphorylase [Acidobacteriota bacterium]HQO25569.1 carboxylating nicotinate-nucleotide diphosphorylase [Acidobacteriota bacterium]
MTADDFVRRRLRAFLREDIGSGDLTTDSFAGLDARRARAVFRARETGVLAGLDFAVEVFRLLDPAVRLVRRDVAEGAAMAAGTVLAEVEAAAGALLRGERTALNIVQRLSGIATLTRQYAAALAGTPVRLLDTRKTTPGFRFFEKYAVRAGGGHNHRLGLYDGVMIKDNHIAAVGDIGAAVRAAREHAPVTVRIEVEAETLAQVDAALAAGADIIMLDNMDPDTMRQAAARVAGRARLEASGRVTLEALPGIAAAGVDYISTSAVISRAHWLDIGLDFVAEEAR